MANENNNNDSSVELIYRIRFTGAGSPLVDHDPPQVAESPSEA